MNLKVESKEQLSYFLGVALNQYEDCTIRIINDKLPVYIICSKISDESTLMALYSDKGTSHVSNVIVNDHESKMEWVNMFYLERLDESYNGMTFTLEVTIKQEVDNLIRDVNIDDESGFYEIEDYREEYLTKHNRMRISQKPISLRSSNELVDLFKKFLIKDDCNKLILSFYTHIKALDHVFMIDLVIDKIYVYGRTLISFIITRPDLGDIEAVCPDDCIFEFKYKNDVNNKELLKILANKIHICYLRCDLVSNHNGVNVDAYSNYNF